MKHIQKIIVLTLLIFNHTSVARLTPKHMGLGVIAATALAVGAKKAIDYLRDPVTVGDAAEKGNILSLRASILLGAQLNTPFKRKGEASLQTPLRLALANNQLDITELLFKHGNRNELLNSLKCIPASAIHHSFLARAAQKKAVGLFITILARIKNDREALCKALHEVWIKNHPACFGYFISEIAQKFPCIVNYFRHPAIIGKAAAQGNIPCLQSSILFGASLNTPSTSHYFNNARVPLISASAHNQPVAIHILLKVGAHVDAVDSHNGSALYYAARYNHVQCAQALLDHCADTEIAGCPFYKDKGTACDKIPKTPLGVAVEKNHSEMVRLLLKHNASIYASMLVQAAQHETLELFMELFNHTKHNKKFMTVVCELLSKKSLECRTQTMQEALRLALACAPRAMNW